MVFAPTTARVAPAGVRLDDGFSTIVAFQADPDVSLWEKTVKPPGMDGGAAIPTSTMHNTQMNTFASRSLKTLTEGNMTVAYDPRVYEQILLLINIETGITFHFADGSTLDFYGYLRTFEPNAISEGAQPEASCSIQPTNCHPTTRAEVLPNYISPTGTDI